jgi:hypothetical protein
MTLEEVKAVLGERPEFVICPPGISQLPDYFTEIAPDPNDGELNKAREILRRLTGTGIRAAL